MMPKKKAPTKTQPASRAFNILDSDIVDATQEAVYSLRARKKNSTTSLKSMSTYKPHYLELDNFALQLTLKTRGLRARTLMEIIAQEGIGKTTLVFTLLGMIMRTSNAPCLFVNTEGENKLPVESRIKRCLDPRPDVADKMYNVLQMSCAYEIRSAVAIIEDFARVSRAYLDANGAQEVPVVVVIDTLSKLMTPGEAAGLLDVEDASVTTKELGTGTNFEGAKLFHEWCRRLIFIQNKYNLMLISVSHQNTKIEMGGFGATMSADVSASRNKTKRNGRAFDQNAALQVTLKRKGFAKNGSGDTIGHKIELRVVKSSVGADDDTLSYVLKTKDFSDEPGVYQEPALDFDEGLADLFVEKKLLGTKVNRKRYTSDELGVTNATAHAFCEALAGRPDIQNRLGAMLGIDGYTPDEWLQEAGLAADSVDDSAQTED